MELPIAIKLIFFLMNIKRKELETQDLTKLQLLMKLIQCLLTKKGIKLYYQAHMLDFLN